MPIYEYRCAKCGFQQEYLQRLNEPPLTKCPECGKKSFNKMVTAAGFQLKGTGWYVTDFKNKGTPAAKKDKPADGAGKDAAAKDTASKESKSTESAKTESAGGAAASSSS